MDTQVTFDTSTEVRNVEDGDCLPESLYTGFEKMPMDSDWAWIAVKKATINGILIAAPCHGVVFIARLVVRRDAPFETLPLLLRNFFKDAKGRGFSGFITYLDPTRDEESALLRLVRKAGGQQVTTPQVLVAADFNTLGRW
jgi:hypothetical protein